MASSQHRCSVVARLQYLCSPHVLHLITSSQQVSAEVMNSCDDSCYVRVCILAQADTPSALIQGCAPQADTPSALIQGYAPQADTPSALIQGCAPQADTPSALI